MDWMKPGSASRFFGWLLNHGQFAFRLGGKVLEIGPGERRLSESSVTVGIDPKQDVDVLADVGSLPFRNVSFDLCVGHEVFCCNPDTVQNRMLGEIRRVSKAHYLRQWKWCAWPRCGFRI